MTAADRWHTLADAETAVTRCDRCGIPQHIADVRGGTPCPCEEET